MTYLCESTGSPSRYVADMVTTEWTPAASPVVGTTLVRTGARFLKVRRAVLKVPSEAVSRRSKLPSSLHQTSVDSAEGSANAQVAPSCSPVGERVADQVPPAAPV